MRIFLLVIFAAFSCFCSSAQQIEHLRTTRRIRDSIKAEIMIALVNDQRYRWMLQLGTMDNHELDSLRSLDDDAKFRRMALVGKDKVGISRQKKDSLMRLQSRLDSVNYINMSGILYKYGYPKSKSDRYGMSVVFMHSDVFIDTTFLALVKQEVIKGNLEGLEYAILYDRYMEVKHLPKLYFVSTVYNAGKDGIEVERPVDIVATNKARAEIGLELLEK